MDVLSGYNQRATAPLDDIAQLVGLPGKLGRSGADVWDQFQSGQIEAIRDYCELDAMNTYLIYLRWELIRGNLDEPMWKRETQRVRDALSGMEKSHWREFLKAWAQHNSH
jgi:3'-5' exonuclease